MSPSLRAIDVTGVRHRQPNRPLDPFNCTTPRRPPLSPSVLASYNLAGATAGLVRERVMARAYRWVIVAAGERMAA